VWNARGYLQDAHKHPVHGIPVGEYKKHSSVLIRLHISMDAFNYRKLSSLCVVSKHLISELFLNLHVIH
jgi:hypothetical protein